MRRGGKSCTDIDRPDAHALILSDEGRDSYVDVRRIFHLFVPRAITNLETSARRGPYRACEVASPITSDRVIVPQYSIAQPYTTTRCTEQKVDSNYFVQAVGPGCRSRCRGSGQTS